MALTNRHSDLRFNPSSGLAFFHVLVQLLFPIPTMYFASWGVIILRGSFKLHLGVYSVLQNLCNTQVQGPSCVWLIIKWL